MKYIKNILLILVGIVFFVVGFIGFAPVLVVSSIFRLIAGFFTILLFTGLMCFAKAIGTANHVYLVKHYGLEALEGL